MTSFLARRLAWSVAVLATVGLATFVLTYIVPADPARAIAGLRASQADVDQIRHALGLDAPLADQLLAYLRRLLGGDLGYSFSNRRPVAELMLQRLPATIELAGAGLLVELAIGLPLGVAAALRRGSFVDRFANVVREMSKQTQFIVITHSKRTMESASSIYGVTMEEAGISKLISVRFEKE